MRLYLIVRTTNGEYGFPKGHVEGNETEYETAIRELKEETNLEVQIIDGFRCQTEYKFPNRVDVMKRSVYFLGKCTKNDIVCQESEVSEAMFVPIETALELLSFEDTKRILKEADSYICSMVSV
jgi:tRNA nucleotidyltransferase (CCA-adding enzyme)